MLRGRECPRSSPPHSRFCHRLASSIHWTARLADADNSVSMRASSSSYSLKSSKVPESRAIRQEAINSPRRRCWAALKNRSGKFAGVIIVCLWSYFTTPSFSCASAKLSFASAVNMRIGPCALSKSFAPCSVSTSIIASFQPCGVMRHVCLR